MSNASTLAGHVTVEDYAIISGLAGVHQFCYVGQHSFIGGYSKIVQDVLPYMMVDGNPGKARTINKIGLERRGFTSEQISTIRQAYKVLYRQGLNTTSALEKLQSEFPPNIDIQNLIKFIQRSERGVDVRALSAMAVAPLGHRAWDSKELA